MKKLGMLGIVLGIIMSCSLVFAGMEHDHSAHEESKKDHSKMGHSKEAHAHGDKNVVEKDGYQVRFDFIDLKERMKDMNMGEMDMDGKTHHLMVFIVGADGKNVVDAKVKFKMFAPDKKESEAMAMKMGMGFGADINLGAKGKHGVAALIKMGDKSLVVKKHFENK